MTRQPHATADDGPPALHVQSGVWRLRRAEHTVSGLLWAYAARLDDHRCVLIDPDAGSFAAYRRTIEPAGWRAVAVICTNAAAVIDASARDVCALEAPLYCNALRPVRGAAAFEDPIQHPRLDRMGVHAVSRRGDADGDLAAYISPGALFAGGMRGLPEGGRAELLPGAAGLVCFGDERGGVRGAAAARAAESLGFLAPAVEVRPVRRVAAAR